MGDLTEGLGLACCVVVDGTHGLTAADVDKARALLAEQETDAAGIAPAVEAALQAFSESEARRASQGSDYWKQLLRAGREESRRLKEAKRLQKEETRKEKKERKKENKREKQEQISRGGTHDADCWDEEGYDKAGQVEKAKKEKKDKTEKTRERQQDDEHDQC